jgi:hypothetical protein
VRHDVFISFSSKDSDKAHSVYDGLGVRGIKCWISSRDIPGGGNYQNEIVKSLTAAKVMVLIFSANANSSEEIPKEVSLAAKNGLVLIPLKIDDFEPSGSFLYNLATSQWVEIYPDFDKKLDSVATTIKVILTRSNEFALLVRKAIEDDGVVGPTEQAYLKEEGAKMGLTATQAKVIIEDVIGSASPSNIQKNESQYLQVITKVLEDGVISSIERRMLAEKAKYLGISDTRAHVLLEQEIEKQGISIPPNPSIITMLQPFIPQASSQIPVPQTFANQLFSQPSQSLAAKPVPAPPASHVAPTPSALVATTLSSSSKSGVNVGIIVGAALVAGAVAYVSLRPAPQLPASAQEPVVAPTAGSASLTTSPTVSLPPSVPIAVIEESPATPKETAAIFPPVANPLQAMLDGMKVSNEGVIAAAIDTIKQQPAPLKGDRKTARATNEAGLIALKENAYDEAIAKFSDAMKADYSDQEIVNNLGYAQMMAGKLSEAQVSFRSALMLAPTRSSAWVNLAYAMTKEGRLDEAMSAYLLAFKFSQNQQKTREFLTKQLQEDTDPKARQMAERVLQEIGF